jgi:hypothetical protein
MRHVLRIQGDHSGRGKGHGVYPARELKAAFPSAALAQTSMPCLHCRTPIPVPDGLTLGAFIDRETAGKEGFVTLHLIHVERDDWNA